jgi:hypothetical protein
LEQTDNFTGFHLVFLQLSKHPDKVFILFSSDGSISELINGRCSSAALSAMERSGGGWH